MGTSREHLLLLGRQDYAVRSVRVDSKAETWNATFSRMFMVPGDAGSIKDFLQYGAATGHGVRHKSAGERWCISLKHLNKLVGSAIQWWHEV